MMSLLMKGGLKEWRTRVLRLTTVQSCQGRRGVRMNKEALLVLPQTAVSASLAVPVSRRSLQWRWQWWQ